MRGHRGSVLALFGLDNLLLSGGRDNVVRQVHKFVTHMLKNLIYLRVSPM